MNDREMLQLAAKAAGLQLVWGDKFKLGGDEIDCTDIPYTRSGQPDEGDVFWNPLTDDGDAFRLADQLQLNVDFCCYRVVRGTKIDVLEDVETGRTAIRRAIVRAAAEIGKGDEMTRDDIIRMAREAEPVQPFLTECVFKGDPPAPYENWIDAMAAMLRERRIQRLFIRCATADDWKGDEMTSEDIIRMAREAGFVVDELSQKHQPNCISGTWHLIDEGLTRFAALVAAAEREECAKVADDLAMEHYKNAIELELEKCAGLIRARGQA